MSRECIRFSGVFRAQGNSNIDDQPPIRRIHGADLASISGDSPVRDCKAESRSVVLGPVYSLAAMEGQKNLREHRFRHARPPIPNSNDRAITFAADRHVDGSSLASEANAIADDILDSAAADNVRWLVLARGAGIALVGGGIGMVGAFFLTRELDSPLFGVEALNMVNFVAMSIVMLGVALAASYGPARRASAVDPMVSLRE